MRNGPIWVRPILAAAVVATTAAPARAGKIWDGGGGNDNWTTGANWNLTLGEFRPSPPPNNGTADIRMAGTTRLAPFVDVPYSINSLAFNNSAGAFVVFGNELTIGSGGVTNNDADTQSVFSPIRLASNQVFNAASGRLNFDAVNLNGFDLTVDGAFQTDMLSVISGAGDVRLFSTFTGTVTMAGRGSNTYSGRTFVNNGGTLLLNKTSGAVAIPGALDIAGTVRLGANEQISDASNARVTVGSPDFAGLLDLNGHVETIGSLFLFGGASVTTGTGRLVIDERIVAWEPAMVTGNIDLNGGNPILDGPFNGGELIIDGPISNGGADFSGDVVLRGAANTYTGRTVVNWSVLLHKSGVDGAFRGDVTIRGNVLLQANEQILAAPGMKYSSTAAI